MSQTVFEPWNDPDAKPLIQFKNVTKRFGEFTAIDNQSFDIYEKEFFALLGPSGCGKTTMMRMLAGFEKPTEGTILLGGQDIAPFPPNKRAVNMMFQSYALFPHLSVWDNIAFGLKRDGKSKDEIAARVEEMLKLTRLEQFARRKPHQISGGQRQRVALARSLAKAPKLLLLDEPLGALDAKLRQATQFELMDIQEKTGTTFVIVTHDQEEAMTVASRVAVMDTGKIIQADTPQVIYEAPASRYVADFIGDVNLIDGMAEAREGGAEAAPTAESETPAQPEAQPPAAEQAPRAPQPNERGKWLHDKLFKYILGPREDAPKQLPPPTPEESKAAASAVQPYAIAPGGITIHWAEGQPPLIASNGDPALAGKRVTLAVRPEKLGISKDRPESANALRGKVIDIAYLGNLSTYHVELANGTMVKAQLANTRRVAQRDITWEDEVWISFRDTAGVVLGE
ncbi:Spermidine/putrescine import ATP-binding protein PotA [Roseovarius tolerans]|uniref:Spermidine/putrescine import ATP-binding protein PotA n=1 Tax=Roseovarius tolerans TaxID=74031 RepID=A0A0L6CTW1_9RHOB|nr:ABC transporter ATP-binding protein [Roseovarius tolerans]KNX41212.1 Spermidine/putrescine import ATP-binding protein PotA [Roseovarius tolerans]